MSLSFSLSLSLSLPLSPSRSLARSLAPCCHSLPAATRSLLPLAPCCHSANTRTLPPHACYRNCSGSRALTSPLPTRYRVSTGAQIRNIRRSHHNLGTLTGDLLTNEKQKRKQKTAVILSALGLAAPNSPAAEVLTGTMARAAQSPPTRIRPTAVPARASTSAPGPASRSKAAAARSARPAQPAPPPRRLAPGPSTPTRAGPRAAERARAAERLLPPPPRFQRLTLQACWRQVQHRRRRGMDREIDGLTDRKNPSREQIERTSREKQRVDGSAARTCLLERALFSSFTFSLSTFLLCTLRDSSRMCE